MPQGHSIRVTPYWFLGFVEGDGSFSITSRPHFGLLLHMTAYNKQRPLMLAIKNYIDHLGLDSSSFSDKNLCKIEDLLGKRSFIYEESAGRGENTLPTIKLITTRVDFLMDHLVPLLSSRTFFTKKFLDFQDFCLAGLIIQSGKHTTESGIKLLDLLRGGMNTGRDYINDLGKSEDLKYLIEKVLAMDPIYCLNKDGLRINAESLALIPNQIFYILCSSSEESIIFTSSEECGRFFGVTKQTINVRLASGKALKHMGKEYFINRKGFKPCQFETN